MRKMMLGFAAAGALAGCGTNESAITIHGVVIPSESQGSCEFGSAENDHLVAIVLDTSNSYTMTLALDVENRHAKREFFKGVRGNNYTEMIGNDFQPLRYDLRWECDSPGFSSDLGPLVVPAFDFDQPFCLDRRSEVNQDFVGFDVIAASGPVIAPEEFGITMITPIPYQLGLAIDDTFEIARYADDCCRNTDGCDGTTAAFAGAVLESCTRLGEIFTTLDPNGSELSVKAPDSGTASSDLVRFRPFAIYHGTYASQKIERTHAQYGAAYGVRLRGSLEGMLGDGDLVSSNEFSIQISLCKECGSYGANRRLPLAGNPCLFLP